MAVESVITARRNADLIAEIAPLWIGEDDRVLDATYGRGLWWTRFRPAWLITNDIDPATDAMCRYDFRSLHDYLVPAYDVVVFDPPYVAKGGRDTSGIKDFDARYGLHGAPKDPYLLRRFIGSGIDSCSRLLVPKGRLLVKVMDYISSGQYQFGLGDVVTAAEKSGLRMVDLFIHASRPGPQPTKNRDGSPRRQVHSRRSHSYLVVFQKEAR